MLAPNCLFLSWRIILRNRLGLIWPWTCKTDSTFAHPVLIWCEHSASRESAMNMPFAIAVVLVASLGQVPPQTALAGTTSRLESTCLQKAQWPITASHEYRNAAVTTKQAMSNAYNRDVSEMKSLCYRATTTASSTLLASEQQALMSRLSLRYDGEFQTAQQSYAATLSRLLAHKD